MSWLEIPGTRIHQPNVFRVNDVVVAGARRMAVSGEGDFVVWDVNAAKLERRDLGFGHARCLDFDAAGQVGWIGMFVGTGAGSRLLKTTTGGRSWDPVDAVNFASTHPIEGICGIQVIDSQTALACGTFRNSQRPALVKTVDGLQWTEASIVEGACGLTDLHFWNAEEGLVVGTLQVAPGIVAPLVALTSDGGTTWRRAKVPNGFPTDAFLWKVFFLDRHTGFASVDSRSMGALLKTCDGGESWTRLDVQAQVNSWELQGVGFLNECVGWVCPRRDFALATVDGGRTWKSDPVLKDMNRVLVTAEGVLAVGDALYWRAP